MTSRIQPRGRQLPMDININMKEQQLYDNKPYYSKQQTKPQQQSPFYQDDGIGFQDSIDKQIRSNSAKPAYDYAAGAGKGGVTKLQSQQITDIFNVNADSNKDQYQNIDYSNNRQQNNNYSFNRNNNGNVNRVSNNSMNRNNGNNNYNNNNYQDQYSSNLTSFSQTRNRQVIDPKNDPEFQKNMAKFYAVNEPSITDQTKQKQAELMNDPQFKKNLAKFYATNEPSLIDQQEKKQKQMQNDPDFQKNLAKFYAANEPSIQHQQQQKDDKILNDPNFQKNMARFYATNEPSLNEKQQQKQLVIASDPKFQENLAKFYAVNEKSLEEQTNQKQKQILNDPKFQSNLKKFYAAEEPTTEKQKEFKEKQLSNDPAYIRNMEKFYALGEPNLKKKTVPQDAETQGNGKAPWEKEVYSFLGKNRSFSNNDSRTSLAPNAQYNNPITQENDTGNSRTNQSFSKPNIGKHVVLTEQNRNLIKASEDFLNARGISEYMAFTLPGGSLGFLNNRIWQNSFYEFLNYAGDIANVYLFSSLISDQAKELFGNEPAISKSQQESQVQQISDRLQQSKNKIMQKKYKIGGTIFGIVLDARGNSIRAF